jgi:hypothetical protein
MSLDLKNVIGSFMLGSAIMYAGVSLLGHQNTPCLTKTVRTRKNIPLLTSSTKRYVPKPILKSRKDNIFPLVETSIDTMNQNKDTIGAYLDKGTSLIVSLAHILWYKSDKKVSYQDYSSSFYKELQKGWGKYNIQKSLDHLPPDKFMEIFRLCKRKDLIFLHPSSTDSITFNGVEKGYYKGNINETTPYIVNVGNKFFPGVGKLDSRMIDLIKKSYTDITESQHIAPIQINCSGTVRF